MLLILLFAPEVAIDLNTIRKEYELAANDEEVAKTLLFKLTDQAHRSTTVLGYKGAVTMMMAKFHYNPLTKLDYFNSGKTLLEDAITKDRYNIELIFLRFTVQSNAPAFLDYRNQLNKDKYFLLSHLSLVKDADLKRRIQLFLKSSPYLSNDERNRI